MTDRRPPQALPLRVLFVFCFEMGSLSIAQAYLEATVLPNASNTGVSHHALLM